jgi:1,4-dihydroxy-2-naphthoate octaprenyltransferase
MGSSSLFSFWYNYLMNKSTFWKVSVMLIYYIVATIIAGFVVGFIEGYLGSAGLLTLSQSVSDWATFILSLIGGMIGLFYGVKFVSKKTIISKKDRNQSMIWFAVFELAVIILSFVAPSFQLFPSDLSILIIGCLAIFIFFQKRLKSNDATKVA